MPGEPKIGDALLFDGATSLDRPVYLALIAKLVNLKR
jgi:hypothetical protein